MSPETLLFFMYALRFTPYCSLHCSLVGDNNIGNWFTVSFADEYLCLCFCLCLWCTDNVDHIHCIEAKWLTVGKKENAKWLQKMVFVLYLFVFVFVFVFVLEPSGSQWGKRGNAKWLQKMGQNWQEGTNWRPERKQSNLDRETKEIKLYGLGRLKKSLIDGHLLEWEQSL